MSDALSVVGSAVGIISLGIQVCQGLVSYLQSFKSQDQEIQDSIKEAQTIVSLFNSVKYVLLTLDQHSARVIAVVDCLNDCEKKLRELQLFLHKLQKSSEPIKNTRQKIKDARHSFAYPFLEGKLLSLRQSLQNLLQNLDLAVNIASLCISDLMTQMCHQLHGVNGAVQSQGLHIAQTSDHLLAQDKAIAIRFRDAEEILSQFTTAAQDFRQEIVAQTTVAASSLSQMMSRNQHLQEELSERLGRCLEEMGRERGYAKNVLGSYIGLETTAIDSSVTRTLQASKNSTNPRASIRELPGCHCKLGDRPWKYSVQFWNIKIEYERSLERHKRGCRYFGIGCEMRRTDVQIPLNVALFSSRFILACIQYSHGTASPGLTIRYQNVVPQKHSAVFDELSKLHFGFLFRDRDPSGSDIALAVENTERAILSLYRDGKASPSDRDEYGCNQAEIACGLITLFYNEVMNSSVSNTTRTVAVMASIRLIKIISSFVGAEDVNIGATNMAVLLRNQEHEWIRLYATFDLSWHDIIRRALCSKYIRLSSLWPLICDSGQYCETPLLIQAIIQESEDLLKLHLLKKQTGLSPVFHGFTPFQLCIQWPRGIEMLLSSQINSPLDEDALSLAVCSDRADSVKVFLEAGCPMEYGCKTRKIFHITSKRCLAFIASNLVARRQALLLLAQKQLGILYDLDHPTDLPEDQASRICTSLDKSGIPVPPALRVPPTYATIYHFSGTLLHHYRTLYDHGFGRLSSRNAVGLTFVMRERFLHPASTWLCNKSQILDIMTWLDSKGIFDEMVTDPLGLRLNIQATGWHYIASFIGDNPGWFSSYTHLPARFLSTVLAKSARDQCACWCTSEEKGCLPIHVFLKSRAIKKHHGREHDLYSYLHHLAEKSEAYDLGVQTYYLEVIRFLTFEALEMTHTCSDFVKFTMVDDPGSSSGYARAITDCDSENSHGIRSGVEEQHNMSLLEDLVKEFAQIMTSMDLKSISLEGFIYGYWRNRISKLFAVDPEFINTIHYSQVSMDLYLLTSPTDVLPERLRCLLDKDFELKRP
ncbi:uncharacterized protein FFB20_13807 [Fusarium fujikuroi]|nr:uncharacterized protein FFE2_00348 [Fusarium fujikuroi]SCN69176.1 uncharacterized protein FFC1_00343 [Fusarium fujikuroi]SCO11367.1 uncharacterized protein FFB20_13807 [Fusarium fujikuroi]SCO28462.1 uncharacterized protein FFNC_00346 [Fusarium fujikuroi]